MSRIPDFPFSDPQYLGLRGRLIGFFTNRQCRCPADLADDTMLRVWLTNPRRPSESSLDRWAFAVARNVLREWRRGNLRTVQLDGASLARAASRYMPEFDFNLLPMGTSDRAFFREYFIEDSGARTLARESGMSEAGVRSRAHRLKLRLREQFVCARIPRPVEI
jgi:DNA-directed RNA polymerase specialized sigma24 family protein